jgi:cbb3-type cytochrome c oxidase subunit III
MLMSLSDDVETRMKRLIAILVTAAAPITLIACHRSSSSQAATAAGHTDSPVHTISITQYQPDLHVAPGRDVFAVACLSCHSQRYIVMQPVMPAPKWEAVVRKMMTTYNAPIADDQIAPIAQYIVAARAAAPHQTWDALAVETPSDLPNVDLSHADVSRGAQLFSRSCAPCHGATGAGNGYSANVSLPHPNNLATDRMTASAIYASIHYGVRGAAMPAAVELSPADVTDVVAYVQQLEPRNDQPQAAIESMDATEARDLYAANCVSCHGQSGLGDGPAAAAAARRPANFHIKQPTPDYAYTVITSGIPGTTMPAWKTKLTDAQRHALANYVRTFYQK